MKVQFDVGYHDKILYQNVELDIPEKGILSILGDNGSGKSTIFKTLLHIIPPIHGFIPKELDKYGGIVADYINAPGEVKVRDILNLLPKESRVENVTFQQIAKRIENNRNKYVFQLSSEQKRMLEIYVLLALGKKYVFLDEATNGLDYTNKKLVLDYVKELSQYIVFFHTSHDFNEAVYLSSTIYILCPNTKSVVMYPSNIPIEVDKIQQIMIEGEFNG